jgi:hypothetical protein
MNILNAIGCAVTLAVVGCVAVPIGALCSSIGFTGVAALVGAIAVVSIIQ